MIPAGPAHLTCARMRRHAGNEDRLEQRIQASKATLASILFENILPFWEPRIVDSRRGGYHTNHDPRGASLGPAPRHKVGQSQVLWLFSRLAKFNGEQPVAAEAARHGYRYLCERMLDQRHGGFYWEVSPSGRPLKPHKHVLGQACAIHALCEYGRAFGDQGAHELAHELATEMVGLVRGTRDEALGGYRELWRFDWKQPAQESGYFSRDPSGRSFATHLHLLESLAAHQAVRPDPQHRREIEELETLLSGLAGRRGLVTEYGFGRDWSPVTPRLARRVDYGHELKALSLLIVARDITGRSNDPLLFLRRQAFDSLLRGGYDRRRGGNYRLGPPGLPASRREKVWWVQAEGLSCALRLYMLSGEPRYGRAFLGTLRWIEERQADWRWGDWHQELRWSGRPAGNKAWTWKTPYHQGRAMLDCLALLAEADDRGGLGER
jgi:mannobiose 2-epimerase